MERIYYTKPSITQKEIDYATDAATFGWGDKCYDYIYRFEEAFQSYVGVNYTIATSSCTGALHMGLAALGIGYGDEVIIGDINWIASAAPITYLGATPVLVDVKEDSWCIDPAKIEAAITEKTKAIIAVHLYGNLCDMDEILKIGQKHDIPVIEDAAEAIGSIYKGKKAGSLGIFSIFSFHGTKTVTTGEGGMFATNNQALYDKVSMLANHGRNKNQAKQFWPDTVGFKYKMSNIQAAIGCAQLKRIDELVKRKREIFKLYEKKLSLLPVKMNPEPEDCQNGFWMTTIIVNKNVNFDRNKLLEIFKENNIDGRIFFWPLSMIRKEFIKSDENKVSYSLYNRGVNLPCYNDITEQDVDRVVFCIKNALNLKA